MEIGIRKETDNQMILQIKYKLWHKQSAKNLEVGKGRGC